jgi:hypothetical protein
MAEAGFFTVYWKETFKGPFNMERITTYDLGKQNKSNKSLNVKIRKTASF